MLVFLGLLISAHQSLPPDTPAGVKGRTRKAGWRIFAAFALSIACVGMALAWLVIPGGTCLYRATIFIFATDLLTIVAVAGLTTKRLLR